MRRQHLDLGCKHFDFAGRQASLTVSGVRSFTLPSIRITHSERTVSASLKSRRVRIDDDLGHAVVIAQIDEQNTAMVAHAVHPAREPDIGAGVALAKRGAGVGTVAMHVISSRLGRRADNGGSAGVKTRSITVSARGRNRAEKRMTHPVCQAERAQSVL
jgi:hypothetical protein